MKAGTIWVVWCLINSMRHILLINIILLFTSLGSQTTAQTPSSLPTKISGVDHSRAKNLPRPSFPTGCSCKFAKDESVIVEAWLDSYGKIYKATAISGHPVLRTSAQVAARKSEFTPNRVSNVLTGAKTFIKYRFIENGKIRIRVEVIKVETEPSWFESCSDCTPVRLIPTSVSVPKFPAAAEFLNLATTVDGEIIVSEGGKVESARAVSGHPLLRKTAEDAALLAEFAISKQTPHRPRYILTLPYEFKR
jgi:hypothetical protein